MTLWEYLSWPFAKLMLWFYGLTNNYGLTLFLFSLTINLVLAPFMAKSKKSMMRTTRLQPRIQELQKRHAGNQQQLQAEMQKLYQEEGINPASGCLWSLLPMFLLFPIYRIVIMPISRMMYASSPDTGEAVVEAMKAFFTNQGVEFAASGRSSYYVQIQLTNLFHQNKEAVLEALRSATDAAGNALNISNLVDMDLSFLGLDLGATPQVATLWAGPYTWAAIGLFLIPLVSAAFSWVSMKLTKKLNPQPAGNEQGQGMMKGMDLMMPLMSVWFCFIMPAAMGVYWIANSLFGMVREFILTTIYKKRLEEEDAIREANRSERERERELEEKRLETERMRAEGKTEQNVNTSKKKIQASEKQKSDERKAALDRADRAARRERLGIPETEKPASQVGNRRYARGRAYVEDRYSNPEEAEEATAKAALESEDAPSIDESVEDPGEV